MLCILWEWARKITLACADDPYHIVIWCLRITNLSNLKIFALTHEFSVYAATHDLNVEWIMFPLFLSIHIPFQTVPAPLKYSSVLFLQLFLSFLTVLNCYSVPSIPHAMFLICSCSLLFLSVPAAPQCSWCSLFLISFSALWMPACWPSVVQSW